MRVVLDTNVLVRAAKANNNPARELFGIVSADPHVLIVSPYLLDEVGRVLRYPRVQKQHGLNDEEMRAFVSNLREVAAVVELEAAQDPPLSPDPDDDPILQTAAYGQAQALCTRDRHFRIARSAESRFSPISSCFTFCASRSPHRRPSCEARGQQPVDRFLIVT